MKRIIGIFSLIVALIAIPRTAWAWSYINNLLDTEKRGITNLVTGVFEFPIAIQEAHGGEYWGLNYAEGIVTGLGKAITRTASGALDIPTGFIPGCQGGFPPDPETLFY